MAITAFSLTAGSSTLSPAAFSFGFTANAGDLIYVVMGVDSPITGITWPSPWVEQRDDAGTNFRASLAYLIATGGETSVTLTGSGTADRWEGVGWRIPAGEWHGTTAPEVGAPASGSTANPDPPSITPSWGSATNNIFIAAAVRDDSVVNTITAYPTNYSTAQLDNNATTSGGNAGGAVRLVTGSPEDPGTFTISAAETWNAYTIAIRPAASGTLYTPATMNGGLSFVGSLSKMDQKPLAGGLSFSGAFSKRANKPFAGGITPSGAVAKQTNKPLAGGLSFSGALSTSKVFVKALAGGLSFVGSLARQTNKPFAGGITPAGALAKRTNKALAGGLSFVGAFSKRANKALVGGLSFVGSFSRRTNKALTGGLSFSGALAKQTRKALVGVLSFVGAVTPSFIPGASGTLYFKSFTATLSFSGSLSTLRQRIRTFAGSALDHPGIGTRGRLPWQSRGLRRRR